MKLLLLFLTVNIYAQMNIVETFKVFDNDFEMYDMNIISYNGKMGFKIGNINMLADNNNFIRALQGRPAEFTLYIIQDVIYFCEGVKVLLRKDFKNRLLYIIIYTDFYTADIPELQYSTNINTLKKWEYLR